MSPAIAIILLLILFPLLWNVALSLRSLQLIELRSVGLISFDLTLDNFKAVLGDINFVSELWRTVAFALLGATTSILLGLWAALVLREHFRGRGFIEALILLPYVVPTVASALTWKNMLNVQSGIVNVWIQRLGLNPLDFLADPSASIQFFGARFDFPLAFASVVAFEAWRYFPFAFLFIHARLKAIPGDLEEAAMVDGATALQRFRYILFPQLKGVIAVLFLLRFIWNFNNFDIVYLLTGGAAETSILPIKIYELLFGRSDVGAAAALSLIMALVLALLLVLYLRFQPEEVE